MKALRAHAIFAAILVGSLIVRGRADVFVEQGRLEPAVFKVARAHGLAFRGYAAIADTGRRALIFDVPGCENPIRLVVRKLTFEEEPFRQLSSEQNYVRRYVYIDHSWDQPHRLAVWAQRAKYAVLATIGQTEYVPSSNLLQIELTPDCSAADAIDWRVVWNRGYLAAANADPESTIR